MNRFTRPGLLVLSLLSLTALAGCQSDYRYQSTLLSDGSIERALYQPLEDFIRAHHSYETPEIVQLPITAGSVDYLQWVASETGG